MDGQPENLRGQSTFYQQALPSGFGDTTDPISANSIKTAIYLIPQVKGALTLCTFQTLAYRILLMPIQVL
jgi:hypothetical protein